MTKVFISHASKDLGITQLFIDLILNGALAVSINEIFCTTTDGTKIESGEDWRNSIKEALVDAKVTFLIITPNYKESEVCMNEMGSAWVSSGKIVPLIVDPISYSSVGIIQQPKQVEKLLDSKSLDRIRDIVQKKLSIDPDKIKSDRWSSKKIEFLQKANKQIEENPFGSPLSRDVFDELLNNNTTMEGALELVISEKTLLEAKIEELKKAKNAEEVKEIEQRHRDTDSMDQFQKLCGDITKHLSGMSAIVIGIIFNSFSKKDLRLNFRNRHEEISEAKAVDYITYDLEVDWETTSIMRHLEKSLNKLDTFIRKQEEGDLEFLDAYDEEFNAPMSLSNLNFWEEAFNTSVAIS